jgi:hypothetical protein
MSAKARLHSRLQSVSAAGRSAMRLLHQITSHRCAGHPDRGSYVGGQVAAHHLWLSEFMAERHVAVELCRLRLPRKCSPLPAAGVLGVWGSVDRLGKAGQGTDAVGSHHRAASYFGAAALTHCQKLGRDGYGVPPAVPELRDTLHAGFRK